MRDAADAVLYVGKARNLRKRLGSYRVANPDRLARRQLRLLRAVTHIEFQLCPDEFSATAKESELLRTLKPKFNRAGTWPARPRFLLWRCVEDQLEITVSETPEADWRTFGPLGPAALMLRAVLVRLLWGALHPRLGLANMPAGWLHGRMKNRTAIRCGPETQTADDLLLEFFKGDPRRFTEWVEARFDVNLHPFELAVRDADLEAAVEFRRKRLPRPCL